ncbi:hypothetical protein GCM10007977_053300 [Dactylosporangium sucinum]|uniref:Uncharacterized protein n=1 Tax=Dactylosporangium sucinum TaxID=1424081 RepID=A0A917U128_9ACTN|nr:hypothetical protein GCM10007977_053300 [Dactylosporangium sucinum]
MTAWTEYAQAAAAALTFVSTALNLGLAVAAHRRRRRAAARSAPSARRRKIGDQPDHGGPGAA